MDNTKTPIYKEELIGLRKQFEEWLPSESLSLFDDSATGMGKEITKPLKLAVGDLAPFFTLPNALGKEISLESYLEKGPVIITFYRGVWCPYCNLVLNNYQRILPDIKAAGANLLAISPQTPDHSLSTKEKNELEFEVLSDHDNKVAKQYVYVFRSDDSITDEAMKLGYDFSDFNNLEEIEFPVPGVYILNQQGYVVFAKSEGGDYRNRVEANDILNALKNLN